MSETAETSRIGAIEGRVFELIRDREDSVLIGRMMRDIHQRVPGLSLDEAAELDLRLKTESFLSPADANKSLAGLAILACFEGDTITTESLRSHFAQRFNLNEVKLAYLEREGIDKSQEQRDSIDLFC